MNNIKQFIPKINIKTEVPEPKRCCFCVPLRYGLLTWGYVKMALELVVFLFGALVVQAYSQFLMFAGTAIVPYIAVGMLMLLFLMVDMGMTIAFLIGGHQKTTKLLRVFYVYSYVILVILVLVAILSAAMKESYEGRDPRVYKKYVIFSSIETFLWFLSIFVQIYMIILLRSEINKLSRRRNFRFSNINEDVESTETTQNGNIESGRTYSYEQTNAKQTETEPKDGNDFTYAKF